MTRGNNRHTVFESKEDYLYYLDLIDKYKSEHPFDLFYYCLMPSHTHFLVKTNKASDYSTFTKRLNLAYFHHYRQSYDWIGHFWQDRFKSQFVGKDAYLLQCGKYIELNPVRAGLAEMPEEYRYSRFKFYTNGVKNHLVTTDIFYQELGRTNEERKANYKKMVIDDIVVSNYLKPVWGSDPQRYNETKKIKNHLGKSY